MATNFPTSLDSFTNPSSSSTLDSPSHAAQHSNVNDAVEALQAKVGVDGSAVTTSLDYKVANQGLTLVKSQTIGSGVSSVTVTGAFSSTFENYRVTVSGVSSYTTGAAWQLRFTGAGTTSYYYNTAYVLIGAAGGYSFVNGSATSFVEFGAVWSTSGDIIGAGTTTNYITTTCISSGDYARTTQGQVNYNSVPSGFSLTPNTGTITGGTIRVYGYNNG